MTDLPPIEYLDEAAKAAGWNDWKDIPEFGYTGEVQSIIAHARALHQLAQARAELAALKPRETLEDVARREADLRRKGHGFGFCDGFYYGFLRAAEMAKKGELPDE